MCDFQPEFENKLGEITLYNLDFRYVLAKILISNSGWKSHIFYYIFLKLDFDIYYNFKILLKIIKISDLPIGFGISKITYFKR